MKKFFQILILLFLLASCGGVSEKALEMSKIVWEDCKNEKFWTWFEAGSDIFSRLQCGILEVPSDYNDKNSPKISLALTKMPAEWEDPIGHLVTIMWWPGQSGINFSANFLWEDEFSQEIQKKFHIIGYAPRGIHPSMPFISCEGDDYLYGKNFVKACQKSTPDYLLKNISVMDAVKDVHSIQWALWEEKTSFIGFSYGTKVLAHFSLQYPHLVRAGVLDGVVDITDNKFAFSVKQQEWFQKSFEKFARYCLIRHEGCFLENANEWDFAYRMHQEFRKMEELEVVDSEGDQILGYILIDFLTSALYYEDEWDFFIDAVISAKQGNMDGYNTLLSYWRNENPYKIIENKKFSESDARKAIWCADGAPKMSQRIKEKYIYENQIIDSMDSFDNYDAVSPDSYLDECFYWPYEWKDSYSPEIPENLPHLLFVSNTDDPTTPHNNAIFMAKWFHDSPLLTISGNAHSIGLSGRNVCADENIVSFLLHPEKSKNNSYCYSALHSEY